MIGVIGTGNMGKALILGAAKKFGADKVIAFDKDSGKLETLNVIVFDNTTGKVETIKIATAADNSELTKKSDILVLAVKPQIIESVLDEIRPEIVSSKTRKTVISIAPGITTDYLNNKLDNQANIVRVMPNTPAKINEGMSAITFAKDFDGDKNAVFDIFEAVGKYEELPENLMNAAVVANGSSPAFVYMFIEALADGAVKYGIPRDKAYKMAAQTLVGSAKMVLQSDEHPGALKDAVCSPGGTTICGVAALEEAGFRSAIIKACDAVYEKTISLEK